VESRIVEDGRIEGKRKGIGGVEENGALLTKKGRKNDAIVTQPLGERGRLWYSPACHHEDSGMEKLWRNPGA